MPPKRSTRDPKSPDFPHGTRSGYRRGCHAGDPCPTTPTCTQVNSQLSHRYQPARDVPAPGTARLGHHVRKRLAETLLHTNVVHLARRTGLTMGQVTTVLRGTETWLPEKVADPLDKAWAWFKYGTDLDTIPAEKHGSRNLYFLGCRCVACCHTHTAATKRSRAGIEAPAVVVAVSEQLVDHTQQLLEAAGTVGALSRVTGLENSVIVRVLAGTGGVKKPTQTRLYAHTPEEVGEAVGDDRLIDNTHTRLLLGQLAAQGYAASWILETTGFTAACRFRTGSNKVRLRVAQEIEKLHAELCDTPATTEATGLAPGKITFTRRQAAAAGYYPAICYDEHGNVNVRSLPDHPWSSADRRAAATLDALYLRTRCDASLGAIADVSGAGQKALERLYKKAGLKSSRHGVLDLRPESVPVAERIKATYWRYDAGQVGPVEALLILGFTRTLPIGGEAEIPPNHPEWTAFHRTTGVAAA